jgi:hypothetical protein
MEYPTPRIQQLSFRLAILLSDLNRQVTSLQQRLGTTPSDSETDDHIPKSKGRKSKEWKITLKDILTASAEDGE